MGSANRARSLLIAIFAVVAGMGSSPATSDLSLAGVTTPDPPEVTLLIHERLDNLPAAPIDAGAFVLELAPGVATSQFATRGIWLLLVERGRILVRQHVGLDDAVPDLASGAAATPPSRSVEQSLGAGERAVMPFGVRIALENQGSEPARLFIVALMSSSHGASPGTGRAVATRPAGVRSGRSSAVQSRRRPWHEGSARCFR